MTATFWPEFGILFAAALIGATAVLPYSLRLAQNKPLKFSRPVLFLLSTLQSAILSGIAVGFGLLAAHAVGLGAPYLEAVLRGTSAPQPAGLLVALALGVVTGAVLLVADLFLEPYWPQALRDFALTTTLLENFLASFYGGINEELLMRLFGFSVLAWLLSLIWHTTTGAPTIIVFWIANAIMAILFGVGHLPALKGLLGNIPGLMFIRTLLLNALPGLLCGWLFWTYGIEAAIIAHFSADIVYHVIGTMILRHKAGAVG